MEIHGGAEWRGQTYRKRNSWQLQVRDDPTAKDQKRSQNVELSVGDIGLSSRVANRLEDASVFTVQDLLARQEELIDVLQALGTKALLDCCLALRNLGFDSIYCIAPPPRTSRR